MVFIDKLYKIFNNPDSYLKDIISKKTVNIHDTRLYTINISYKLKAIIRDLNGKTLFFTVSVVNIQ